MKAFRFSPAILGFAVVLVVLRILLMIQFPVVADEAYYFYWGTHPAGGYYDLPPMVGWWETFLTSFSLNTFWLRLPNLVTLVLIAFGIREWTKPVLGSTSASLLGMAYFFLPVTFVAIMVAPDLPLLFFTFYSSVLFYDACNKQKQNQDERLSFLLSGALWGAAFLSKYFAVFSIPALLFWYFAQNRKTNKRGLLWFAAGALPFVFQHLIWNANHCWANFVFNLVTRQKASDGAWGDLVLLFFVYVAILSTPFFWKGTFRRAQPVNDQESKLERYFLISWLVPMTLFFVTVLMGRGQGLHWYIPYLPFFIMWIGIRIRGWQSLYRRTLAVMFTSFVLSLVAVVALQFPDRWIKDALKNRHAFEFELAFRTQDLIDSLVPGLNGMHAVALDGYSLASVFDLEFKRRFGKDALPILVMGEGSRFGRVFDFTTDWDAINGKNLMLVARGEWSQHDWSRFFETTEAKWLEQNGVRYWVSKGIGFRSDVYRAEVIARSVANYYPKFLGLPSKCELRNE